MSSYSPFDQELEALEAADLEALTRAREGWYIEYKREVPTAVSIANPFRRSQTLTADGYSTALKKNPKRMPLQVHSPASLARMPTLPNNVFGMPSLV